MVAFGGGAPLLRLPPVAMKPGLKALLYARRGGAWNRPSAVLRRPCQLRGDAAGCISRSTESTREWVERSRRPPWSREARRLRRCYTGKLARLGAGDGCQAHRPHALPREGLGNSPVPALSQARFAALIDVPALTPRSRAAYARRFLPAGSRGHSHAREARNQLVALTVASRPPGALRRSGVCSTAPRRPCAARRRSSDGSPEREGPEAVEVAGARHDAPPGRGPRSSPRTRPPPSVNLRPSAPSGTDGACS